MRKTVLVLSFIALASCDFLETKKVTSEEILSLERKELDWHDVDQYPAFPACKEYLGQKQARECFERTLSTSFKKHLAAQQPVVTEELHDTLLVYLRISEQGEASIDSIAIDSLVMAQLPLIKQWFSESLDSLPRISPATKRGIPVVTAFKVPVIIEAE